MSVFPHSHLWIGESRSVVISGPHIQVLNSSTGDIVCSTVALSDDDKNELLKSGPVRCAAIDRLGRYIATSGDDKVLKVWSLEGLKLLSCREMPKRPTSVSFTRNAQKILVSDKFGDVFSYPLHPVENPITTSTAKRDNFSSHANPSGGDLVLGHASLLTSFLLTPDERYIITADRDEHIRVSWYPEGYSIERYCLGHEKFVSAIHIPAYAPSTLISGGGDPMLKIWDWMSGSILHEIRILDAVQPFIKVKPAKRSGTEYVGDTRADTADKGRKKGKRQPDSRRKGNLPKSIDNNGKAQSPDDDIAMGVGETEEGKTQERPESPMTSKQENTILVIHKIDTSESEGARHIIFNAVGATALFACECPNGVVVSDIQILEFGTPVLDFVIIDDQAIFVLLDGDWNEGSGPGLETLRDGYKFVVGAAFVDGQLLKTSHEKYSSLLASLNSQCLVPAGPPDLRSLDLYNHLSSMPKNTEVEHDPMDEGHLEAVLHNDEEGFAESVQGKKLTKKALGRLKHKRALLAKTKAGLESGGCNTPLPSTKRTKSGHDQDTPMNTGGDKPEV